MAQCCLCIVDFFREAIAFFISYFAVALNINFGLCLSMHMSRYEAPRKLGKQERDVRVAQGAAESNSSLLGASPNSTSASYLNIWTAEA